MSTFSDPVGLNTHTHTHRPPNNASELQITQIILQTPLWVGFPSRFDFLYGLNPHVFLSSVTVTAQPQSESESFRLVSFPCLLLSVISELYSDFTMPVCAVSLFFFAEDRKRFIFDKACNAFKLMCHVVTMRPGPHPEVVWSDRMWSRSAFTPLLAWVSALLINGAFRGSSQNDD